MRFLRSVSGSGKALLRRFWRRGGANREPGFYFLAHLGRLDNLEPLGFLDILGDCQVTAPG